MATSGNDSSTVFLYQSHDCSKHLTDVAMMLLIAESRPEVKETSLRLS
ncbi:hypothetical protein [Geobacter anodireducens]